METDSIFSKEFHDTKVSAMVEAREETLRAGVPVFYGDGSGGYFKELRDGRKFQIRFVSNPPDGYNYEIVREIRSAA